MTMDRNRRRSYGKQPKIDYEHSEMKIRARANAVCRVDLRLASGSSAPGGASVRCLGFVSREYRGGGSPICEPAR